jgi:uncharacterized protein (DUF1330 family)
MELDEIPIRGKDAMAAYLIADTLITDPQAYDEYRRQVAPLITKFGGRFIVRGGKHEVLEGDWQVHRIVAIEFPSMAALKSWYGSPEYAPLIAMRQRASTAVLVAVEGY